MKSQAVATSETIRQAIEAVRRDAGQQELDQLTALVWLLKAAEREIDSLKERVRTSALKKLGSDTKVPLDGRLGTTQVTFMPDSVKLKPSADVDQLKQVLGDRFPELFKIVPERVEPQPGFQDRLLEFDAPKPVIDLVEAAVSYSPRSARVSTPRAPKV
jgi:hypothetical protein